MAISRGKGLILLGIGLVVLDQLTKILVKTNMCLGESIPLINNFLSITFVENEGMAFGMKWGGVAGKIVLSVFRIVLFGALWWWISKLLRREGEDRVPTGVLVGLSVIATGALGNIIDCLFYDMMFSASDWNTIAVFGGSYAPFLLGKVVDMIHFHFFPPVFNVADSCVSCGAVYLVIFHWKFFSSDK